MTKTLTEQWRDKELKDGDYYVINKAGDIVCDYYIEILGHFDSVLTENVKEVLAPVPSYDEWKKLDDELKELATKNDTLAMENGRLEKKLKIAKKALKEYDNKLNWDIRGVSFMKYNKGFTIARKALKEMEGVK